MAIIKRGRNHLVRVRDTNGKWFPAKTFKSKRDAQKYQRELLDRKSNHIVAIDSNMRQMTLENYFCLWMKECRSDVSVGWKKNQLRDFKNHIHPYIGECKFLEVSKRDIALVLNRAKEKGLKSQTIAHLYNLLHKMFEDAIHHFEFLTFNPVIKRYKPKVYQKERSFLTVQESWRPLRSCKGSWLEAPLWVSLFTGMRPCEVQALKWQRVDLSNRRIVISAIFKRSENRIQDHPKQGDWGQAPIPDHLYRYLCELKESNPFCNFVCPGPEGGMMSQRSFLAALKRQCIEIGVTVVTPHELRHSSTELYYTAGASTEDLKRLLNHSSSKTTETYIHRTDERLLRIANQIEAPGPSLKLLK